MIHNNLPKSPNGPIPCPPEQKYNTQNKQQTKNQEYSVIPHQINMPPCCYYGKHKWMTWNGSFNTLYSQTRDWVAACIKQTVTQAAVPCVISACLTLSGWEYTRIRYQEAHGLTGSHWNLTQRSRTLIPHNSSDSAQPLTAPVRHQPSLVAVADREGSEHNIDERMWYSKVKVVQNL